MPDPNVLTLAEVRAAGSEGILCRVVAKENLDSIDLQLGALIDLSIACAPTPIQKITSSETLYFDDGNIVLVSENGVAFKVYKDVLMHRSKLFNAMLANDFNSLDVYDGVPLIRTHDSAENLEILLKLLFAVDSPLFKDFQKAQFNEVLTATLMAHKYLIEAIYEPCRDIVTRIFPSTFKESWDCLEAYDAFAYSPRDVVRAVNIMLQISLFKPVPYACYVLAFLDQKEVCKVLFELRALKRYQELMAYRNLFMKLWFLDLRPLFVPSNVEEVCTDPARTCAAEDERKMGEYAKSSQDLLDPQQWRSTSHPLYRLWALTIFDPASLCSSCSKRPWRERVKSSQQELWNKLPVALGLGTWEILSDIEQIRVSLAMWETE